MSSLKKKNNSTLIYRKHSKQANNTSTVTQPLIQTHVQAGIVVHRVGLSVVTFLMQTKRRGRLPVLQSERGVAGRRCRVTEVREGSLHGGAGAGGEGAEEDEATWERKSSHKVLVARAKRRSVPFRRVRMRDVGSDPRKG